MKHGLIALCVVILALTFLDWGSFSKPATIEQDYPEYVVLTKTNEQRTKNGLKPLVLSPKLNRAANLHAHNMVMEDHLSHELDVRGQRNLSSRLEYVDADDYRSVAENIAWNYSYETVVDGWMKSTGHRRNILGDFQEIGIGVAVNEDGEPYYCQVFGKR